MAQQRLFCLRDDAMKKDSHNSSETGLATGLKVLTIAVVLGFVAMASAPALVPGSVQESAAAAAPAIESVDYFPSHYPAPTAVADEQTPTF
jgi:hypothetical protein